MNVRLRACGQHIDAAAAEHKVCANVCSARAARAPLDMVRVCRQITGVHRTLFVCLFALPPSHGGQHCMRAFNPKLFRLCSDCAGIANRLEARMACVRRSIKYWMRAYQIFCLWRMCCFLFCGGQQFATHRVMNEVLPNCNTTAEHHHSGQCPIRVFWTTSLAISGDRGRDARSALPC